MSIGGEQFAGLISERIQQFGVPEQSMLPSLQQTTNAQFAGSKIKSFFAPFSPFATRQSKASRNSATNICSCGAPFQRAPLNRA